MAGWKAIGLDVGPVWTADTVPLASCFEVGYCDVLPFDIQTCFVEVEFDNLKHCQYGLKSNELNRVLTFV